MIEYDKRRWYRWPTKPKQNGCTNAGPMIKEIYMKRSLYILLLLLALLLTACGKEKIQEPTLATDPNTATTTATAMADVEKFQKLIRDEYWYKRALGCTFEKPEDISAWFYFYLGTGEMGEDDYKYFTSEEKEFLAKAYKDKYGV